MNQKVQTLSLRLMLIDKCEEFSLLRLNHLQQIFKYYCTHIFKIGKHMTFDRLEYQKEHLNTQRFFLFLKDFSLTVMEIDGKPKQIVSKQTIMTIFKKISSNCRDLTFQQFIKCLQKLAIVFYDQKSGYWTKIQQQKLQRIRRKKQIQKRKMKRMKINGQKIDEKQLQQMQKLQQSQKQIQSKTNKKVQKEEQQQGQQNGSQQQKQNDQQDKKDNKKQSLKSPPQINNQNQNDDLIMQLMENKDIQDPNQEINQITNQKKMESLQIQKSKKNKKQYQRQLLTLTNNQKIQYFYQLIGVDSVKQYKNKLTVLNMPQFKNKKLQKQKTIDSSTQNYNKTIDLAASNSNQKLDRSKSQEEQERLMKLKQKMNEKLQKKKNQPIPKPPEQKESQTAKKRRQMKEQRQFRQQQKLKQKQADIDAVKQKNKDQKGTKDKNQQNSVPQSARPSFNQKQVNWAMLQKMSLQQLKLRQFNPTKFYQNEDDDYIFMQEYGNYRMPQINNNRASRMQARQRQSLSIVQNVRKRADQIQKSARKQQTKLNNKVINSTKITSNKKI